MRPATPISSGTIRGRTLVAAAEPPPRPIRVAGRVEQPLEEAARPAMALLVLGARVADEIPELPVHLGVGRPDRYQDVHEPFPAFRPLPSGFF